MRALRPRAALGAACAVLGFGVAACGGGDDGTPAVQTQGEPGEGGTLVWAVGETIDDVDPLAADSPVEQLVTRQIHEPLVARLTGPFREPGEVRGLALGVRPRAGGTRWDVRLRTGVRFHDGTPLNAAAVLANARRWLTTDAGRAALPGLVAADAPRPDLARLFFAAPRADVRELLASPRLGIVAPSALRPRSGTGAEFAAELAIGTGPFELRERSAERLLLAHDPEWWGVDRGIGPALNQVEFRVVPRARSRASALLAGTVHVASELTRRQARASSADPLVAATRLAGGDWIAHERSVRGVEQATTVPSLAAVWLATLGSAP